MERTTESQGHVDSVSHNIGQDTYYNDAHPALFHTLKKPHVSPPTYNGEDVTQKPLTRQQNRDPPVNCLSEAPLCNWR